MHRFSNNAVSTLTAGIDDIATTIRVVSGEETLFDVPATVDGVSYQLVTLTHSSAPGVYEIIALIAQGAGSSFDVFRAMEGTTALTWPVGTQVSARVTAGTLKDFPQLGYAGRQTVMSPDGGPIVLGGGAPYESRSVADRGFVVNGVSRTSGAWVVGGYSVAQRTRVHMEDALDRTMAYESVGASHAVDIGAPMAWSDEYTKAHGRVVRPTTPDGYQYRAEISDLEETDLYSAAEPAFPGTGADVAVGTVGVWVATAMPVNITHDFSSAVRLVVTEVGFINHMLTASSTPTVSIGTTGDATRFANAVSLSQITAQGHTHRIPIATGGAPVGDLTFRVDTAATGGVFMGRFYFKGFFVEPTDEFV